MENLKHLFGCCIVPNAGSFTVDEQGLKLNLVDKNQSIFNLRPDDLYLRVDKVENTVYFNKVEVWNGKNKSTEFSVPKLGHECVLGVNSPRYYSPEFDYTKLDNNILYINSAPVSDLSISPDGNLLDNIITECDIDGNIVWEWSCYENFKKFEFDSSQLESISEMTIIQGFGYDNDWIHLNSVSSLGRNPWYEAGDKRFHPENLIVSSRNLSLIFIIEKSTGDIVYQLNGEKFNFKHQHYAHIIPEGLDGYGNILLFDGFEEPDSKLPQVLEINPTTNEVVAKISGDFGTFAMGSVQKLPTGHYLVASPDKNKVFFFDKDGVLVESYDITERFYRVNWYPEEWVKNYEGSVV